MSEKSIGPKPGGQPSQKGENVPQHKRMAQGVMPSASGPKTKP
jgi:hypothetical protein